jgi:UDP-3-O-[3-hydroxymyristoyl] glucosamine N-acyltransferase
VILRELADRLGCALRGDGDVDVQRVAAIEHAGPGDLTFLANPRYLPRLQTTRASAVIVSPDHPTALPSLLTANPYLVFARAVALLHPDPRPAPGVDPSARVHQTAQLADGVHVGPLAVVGARCRVGRRSVLHAHVVLYDDVTVGEETVLHSAVQVRERCRLGSRVVVQNGAVIGADGFGFARDDQGRWEKIPQVGTVVIEDDVEIGALTAIDRSALAETRIGRGTKIDNLVQIGHSVTIGRDSALAGQVGIAGSARLGDRVTLAGQVGVAGHLTIGDGATITAQSGVPNSVPAGVLYSGAPAMDNRAWLRAIVSFPRLPELQRRVRQLERRVAELSGEHE